MKGKAQAEGMRRAAASAAAVPDGKLCHEVDNQASTFTADTAEKTGRSERAIRLDAERGEKIAPDVMEKISGTPIDTGQTLDELKDLPHEEQRERVAEKKVTPPKAKPKSKTIPAHGPLERKGAPDNGLTTQLDPCFAALWQLSVDLKKSEVREWADKIERALEKKGIVKASERIRDARHYLAKLKPKAAREPSEAKSDVLQ